jgi:meso-butanediol dehydrogenase / (S,S)-butanediol dehydrogenase / diacetyl reductase
MHIFPSFAQM